MHRCIYRQMQRVDFASAIWVLDFPHPLLRIDLDLQRRSRRCRECRRCGNGPPKNENAEKQGPGRPTDLDFVSHESRKRAASGKRAAAVPDGEYQDQREDEQKDEKRNHQQQKEIAIDNLRILRRLSEQISYVHAERFLRSRTTKPPAIARMVSAAAHFSAI